jgi:hypothetical protein
MSRIVMVILIYHRHRHTDSINRSRASIARVVNAIIEI